MADTMRRSNRVPRVSVVIPVYNRQELGERALRSSVAQAVDDIEIIVFDDFSDPPFQIPADLRGRTEVRLLRSEQNGGESASRNAAVAAARADWIAFLDSDDYWLADTLRLRLETAELAYAVTKDPLTVHVAGFEINNKRRGYRQIRIPVASDNPLMFASGCWFCPGSTSLFRKQAIDIVGPSDVVLRRLQDMDWYLRLALAGGRVEVWPEVVAVVETGPKVSIANFEIAVRHLRQKYAAPPSAIRLPADCLHRMEAYFDIERASIFAAHGDWARAAYVMARSIARVPRLTLHLEDFWQRRLSSMSDFDSPERHLEPRNPKDSGRSPTGVPTAQVNTGSHRTKRGGTMP
jgi:glycosyltransferase involved in cell wall biosynthesis